MASVSGQRAGDAARRGEALLLWAGLLVAFSPVLLDLVRHLAEHPWARYAALFPFLFARCALCEPQRPPERRDGYLWIGLGMGVELIGILAGATRIGRVGLALAAIGLCRRFAFASWPSLLLLVLAVPLPNAVLRWISPGAENALLSVASGGLDALGLGIEFVGARAFYGTQELALEHFDSGAALFPLLAGLSWYRSVLLRTPLRIAVLRAAAAALLAIPVQIAAIALALLTLPLGAGAAGRLALIHLPWMAVAAVSLARTELRFRRGRPAMNAERLAVAGLLLAMGIVGATAWWLQLRPPLHADYAPLGTLPMTLGSWSGEATPLDSEAEDMLDADFNLQRTYWSPGRDQLIWLYVGYYGTERGGRPEHLPSECYPSNGWAIERSRTLAIDPRQDFQANEYVVSRLGRQRLVHFWFRSSRRTGMLGGMDVRLDHLTGRLRGGRADGALVRLSTPIAEGGEAEARARLVTFARELDPLLSECWPREFPSG